MFHKSKNITKQCKYLQSCQFVDTSICIDNIFGCMMAHQNSKSLISKKSNKEKAENPEKSRQNF